MKTSLMLLNWTDQGIKIVKSSSKLMAESRPMKAY